MEIEQTRVDSPKKVLVNTIYVLCFTVDLVSRILRVDGHSHPSTKLKIS